MQQRESAMHLESWSILTALSTFFYADGAAICDTPCALRDSSERRNTQRENEMQTKQILKTSVAPAAIFGALAFFTTATPAAAAPVDYCRTDVTSGMRGCGYSSLEQCRSMSAGRGGSCSENPFPSSTSSTSSSSSNAYAFQPKHPLSKTARKPVENR
jgi:hypothetical protein